MSYFLDIDGSMSLTLMSMCVIEGGRENYKIHCVARERNE